MPMYWWIPAPASKPREKPPQLHILSTRDTIFGLQQAPGLLLVAALPYRALVAVWSTRFWAKGNDEHLKQGSTQLQGQAGFAQDAREQGGNISTTALQNTRLARSKSQQECP